MDVEELRLRGNNLYAASDFFSAIDVYSQALQIAPENAIILGNRSACFLATGKPESAEIDARLALTIQPSFVKCYYRLATALKSQGKHEEAIQVANIGLRYDAQSTALRNLKSQCEKEVQGPADISTEKTNAGTIKRGFLSSKGMRSVSARSVTENSSILCGDCTSSRPGPKSIEAHVDESLSISERKMMTYLRSLIKRIVSGGYGAVDVNNHMLQGVFKQLLDASTFSELLFPGAPKSVVENLPRNLRELLCWDLLSLDLANISRKSASIFEGIKSKGEKRGDLMDATTEAILVPQIVEEAFARDVVETVRNLGRKVSGLNAKVVLSLAVPSEVESTWDQLDDGLPANLVNPLEALAVQDEFLGGEWATLILADVRRFAAEEKMSLTSDGASALFMPFAGDTGSAESKSKLDHDPKKTVPTMAWIEIDAVEEGYPALAQAIQQLHALPYEINDKTNYALNLLQPSRGCTLLMHFPVGSHQLVRLDNRLGEYDSGIRVTCAYHLIPARSEDTHNSPNQSNQPVAQLSTSLDCEGSRSATVRAIDIEHDRLAMHQSVRVRNERSVCRGDYYVIYYFIHGK